MQNTKRLIAIVFLLGASVSTGCRSGVIPSDFHQPDFLPPPDLSSDGATDSGIDFGVEDLPFIILDSSIPVPDLAVPVDLAGHDLSSTPDLAHPVDLAHPHDLTVLPDLSNPVAACEQCLATTCPTQAAACTTDSNCTATVSCSVTTHCYALGTTTAAFGQCVDACITSEGLDFMQTTQVFTELGGLATCSASCAGACTP